MIERPCQRIPLCLGRAECGTGGGEAAFRFVAFSGCFGALLLRLRQGRFGFAKLPCCFLG